MALNPRAEQIYELASLWLNECLLNDGSLFWPERQVWTEENLNHFWSAFAENLDEGSGSFVEKWAQQLNGQSDDVHRMAVELTAIYCLFPADKQMGPGSKRKLLNEVLAFSGDLGEMDQSRKSIFDQAIDGGGIGLTGAGYLAARPFHMGMYLGFAKSVKASGAKSIEDLQPKPILNEAFNLVSGTMNYRPVSTKHILLHILWPEKFEDYASADYKKKMAKNLSAHFGLPELDDIDETILQAREHMEANGYEPNFSMYEDKVESLWNYHGDAAPPTAAETSSHIIREKAPVYEIARLFQERVIEQGRSLLWPDQEVWTEDSIDRFILDFETMKYEEGRHWLQVVGRKFGESTDQTVMIFADIHAMLMQFPSIDTIGGGTKSAQLKTILNWRTLAPTNPAIIDKVLSGFELGVGGTGRSFMSNLPFQLAYIAYLVRQLRRDPSLGILGAADQALIETRENPDFRRSAAAGRNVFLHLIQPESYERVASDEQKARIIRVLAPQITEYVQVDGNDVDRNIQKIRPVLADRFFGQGFDFYDDHVEPFWNGDRPLRELKEEVLIEPAALPIARPSITDLAAETFLDESHLHDIESLLTSRKQLIFEGPPGSGKTFVAEKFARYFTGQALTGDRNDRVELVQFHQSYSYEDFVEGIRPETIDGQLHYNVKPGIFRNLANRATNDPEQNYVLIIDEINRGNVSRILGELMLLLEYRDESATLPYSQEPLQIPDNLFIIGTMNSADRSLSQIDYALRRRFYFVRFLSVENGEAKVLRRWLDSQPIDSELRRRILHTFIELNAQLRSHLDTDDLQVGHSYFMNTQIGNDDFRKQVWKYAVIPLIREYLYHHRDRDELLQSYELQRLASIVQPIAEETGEPAARLINESPGEVPE